MTEGGLFSPISRLRRRALFGRVLMLKHVSGFVGLDECLWIVSHLGEVSGLIFLGLWVGRCLCFDIVSRETS